MPFKIVRNDITKMQVDAIVNTANEAPIYESGTDTAVYKAAGEDELLAERRKIGWLREGEVAITPGFKLPAKYIIHAVSPIYIDGECGEEEKLRSCYQKSLKLAHENGCESIAFPLIATGSFGYPKEEGMRIAIDEINAFLLKHEMLVYLVVFDTVSTNLGLKLYPDLEAYIDHHYVCEKREEEYGDRYFGSVPRDSYEYNAYTRLREEVESKVKHVDDMECCSVRMPEMDDHEIVEFSKCMPKVASHMDMCMDDEDEDEFDEGMDSALSFDIDEYYDFLEETESALEERVTHMSDTFQEYLFYLIEAKGLSNADVYKGAIISKQLFSKIKLNPQYHPDKATAIRLCVGARLNLDETKDLLARAGYALSPCDKRDIIFSYFIENEVYNMIDIDIALEEHGLPSFIV